MENPCEECRYYCPHYVLTENGHEKSPYGECGQKKAKKYQMGKLCKKFEDNFLDEVLWQVMEWERREIDFAFWNYCEKIVHWIEILKKNKSSEKVDQLLQRLKEKEIKNFTSED